MRNVAAEATGVSDTDHGIQIGTVNIDLPAGLMHHIADLAHAGFEDAVRRWIGDHNRRDVLAVLGNLGLQIVKIHIALLVARHHNHLESDHVGTGWISPVRRARDQADITIPFAAFAVITHDRQQASILPLRTGVRLQGDGVITGRLTQHDFDLTNHLAITDALLKRHKGMNIGKFRPGDRRHFSCRIEFHGA